MREVYYPPPPQLSHSSTCYPLFPYTHSQSLNAIWAFLMAGPNPMHQHVGISHNVATQSSLMAVHVATLVLNVCLYVLNSLYFCRS